MKVDSEIPAYKVRACEPRASKRNQPAHARAKAVDERCGKNLFTGKLALGEAQLVCTDGESILYAFERPRGGGFGPLIEASCDGTDVQF